MLVHQKQNLLRCTDTGLLRKETIKELLAWSVLFKWPGLSIRGSGSNSSHNTNICRTKSARTLAKHKCLFENPEHKKILKECFVLGEKKNIWWGGGGLYPEGWIEYSTHFRKRWFFKMVIGKEETVLELFIATGWAIWV